MSTADHITAAQRVAAWHSADRAELAARLAETPPVHRLASGGFLVDTGTNVPVWCRDGDAVDRLLVQHARLADEIRGGG